MELLGVGPTEFLFIIVIILIVVGPKDLAKTGSTIGKWLNSLIQSDSWKMVQRTSSELRQLPKNLMREANLEKFQAEKNTKPDPNSNAGTWQGQIKSMLPPISTDPKPDLNQGNVIQPPVIIPTPTDQPPAKKKPSAAPHKKTTPVTKKATRKATKPGIKPSPRKKSNG
jgi:Sec-independent protein translocase protein TatA